MQVNCCCANKSGTCVSVLVIQSISQSIAQVPQVTNQLGSLFCFVLLMRRCTVSQSILAGLGHLSELFD